MTNLNIWISNNTNTYHFDQTRNTLPDKSTLLIFRVFEKDRILFCFNTLKLKNMSKAKQR